ncbi:MAG TPA: hypothetical protein VGR37_08160 [Longimicrobiaceae bacterium]|nr:hypothetical protein [Longimicrobiaceae bacterium]
MKARPLAVLALVAAAACSDAPGPVAPEGAASFLPCLFGAGSSLEVGEVLQFKGTAGEILCLEGGSDKAEFTLVPFYASSNGRARLRVSALGGNVQTASEPGGSASRAPTGAPGEMRSPEELAAGDALHMRLRERMHREASALRRTAPTGLRANVAAAPPEAAAQAVPRVGEILRINVPNFDVPGVSACNAQNVRPGRVAAVSQRAVVVHDVANPAGGFTDAEYQAFADRFDDTVFPVVTTTYGAPTDIDNSGGRVIIYFTRAVNDLTPPGSSGVVGGFFWAGDLIPPQGTQRYQGCRFSNAAEIFYVLAPDPARGGSFSKENVRRGALGTLAHEMEHLISASRRIYLLDAPLEDTWLDEGLAHVAEELVFYRVSGLAPRQNLRLQDLQRNADAANTYILDNLVRYLLYLEEPDSNSLIGIDELPTRGASWAFLRYAADREPGPDQAFFFNLVNSNTTGVANVSARIGASAIDWMQDWTLSVYTDDAVPAVGPQYMQPSWNFRDIMPFFDRDRRFPLEIIRLGANEPAQVSLLGGGAAFFRFGIAPGGRVGIRMATPDRDIPQALRVSIVRTR